MTNKLIRKLFRYDEPLEYYNSSGYYTFFEKYENYKTLLNFLNSSNFNKIEKTDTIICFKGNIEFGMHQSYVKKLLNCKPAWVFQESDISNHEVYFYKWRIGGYRAKAELHFLNHYFFMGVYTFDSYSESDYTKIKNLLFRKYKINNDNLNTQNISIVDNHNNLILLKEIHGISIIYFTGDSQVIKYLLEQEFIFETKRKDEEEKLKNKILAFF